jgi:hypothetical protein
MTTTCRVSWWFVLGCALALGCGDKKEPPPGKGIGEPPPMTEVEKQRGRKACAKYAERACRCAAQHAELVEDCRMAQSRPESLEMALRILESGEDATGKLGAKDRRATQAAARRTIKACFDADARLDPALCPRQPAD